MFNWFKPVDYEVTHLEVIYPPGNKAFVRMAKLVDALIDINSSVDEIKFIRSQWDDLLIGHSHIFSIRTSAGLRFLKVSREELAFFEEYDSEYIQGYKGCNYYKDKTEPLFVIMLDHKDKAIGIRPRLGSDAPMTEKQIYLCLLEIEEIIDKYKYSTRSAEHKANLSTFIKRMEAE